MTTPLTNATTPQLRRDPSVICPFATQLSQTQAIAACGGEVGVVFLGDSITQAGRGSVTLGEPRGGHEKV